MMLAPLLFLCGVFPCGGCGAVMVQAPHLDGRWTGRVVPVEVRDRRGESTYPAAALELTGGTAFGRMFQRVSPELGGGRKPLLATEDTVFRVLNPSDLPGGQEVEVCGTMMIVPADKPKGAPPEGDAMVSRAFPGDELGDEHIIVLRGQPKVLRK